MYASSTSAACFSIIPTKSLPTGLIISDTGVIPNFNVRVNGYKRDGVITDVELINFKTGGTTQIPAYFNGQKNYTFGFSANASIHAPNLSRCIDHERLFTGWGASA